MAHSMGLITWIYRAVAFLSYGLNLSPLSPLGFVGMVLTQRYSAFFYGTLLHPKILKRVIGNDGSHLEICPAVLLVSAAVNHSVRLRETKANL